MRIYFPTGILPAPLTSNWDWQLHAHCRGFAVSTFFPARGTRGSELRRAEESAKQVCARCPVLNDCRSHALNNAEPYGVWGGMSARERAATLTAPAHVPRPRHRIGPPVRRPPTRRDGQSHEAPAGAPLSAGDRRRELRPESTVAVDSSYDVDDRRPKPGF